MLKINRMFQILNLKIFSLKIKKNRIQIKIYFNKEKNLSKLLIKKNQLKM